MTNKHPLSISLSLVEQEELRALIRTESSPMKFWLRAYRTRGIEFRGKTPVAFPSSTPGNFRLEWHARTLGVKSIAQAVQYRKFQEEKDRAFEGRLQQRRQPVWQ